MTDRRLDPRRIHTRLSEPQREALARHPEGGAHDVSWMHWGSWKVLRSAGLLAGESRFESTLTSLGLAVRRIETGRG